MQRLPVKRQKFFPLINFGIQKHYDKINFSNQPFVSHHISKARTNIRYLSRLAKEDKKYAGCSDSQEYLVVEGSKKEESILLYKLIDDPQFQYLKPAGTHLKYGAIKDEPQRAPNSLSFIKVSLVIFAFVYVGGQLSSMGAHLLNKFDIFNLPEEDD